MEHGIDRIADIALNQHGRASVTPVALAYSDLLEALETNSRLRGSGIRATNVDEFAAFTPWRLPCVPRAGYR